MWNLTTQGIEIGVAAFLAMVVLAPNRQAWFEVAMNLVFAVVGAWLLALAVSHA
jgi:hypothetical protein